MVCSGAADRYWIEIYCPCPPGARPYRKFYQIFIHGAVFPHMKFTPPGAFPQAAKEAPHERRHRPLIRLRDLHPALSLRTPGGARVMLDLTLGGIISAGLLVYLIWAMLRPEDF